MNNNLSKCCKVTRVLNAVAAGTTNQNGAVIDMQGFEGVMIIAEFGAITGTAVTGLKAQQGTVSDGSDMADLINSLVSVPDTASNKVAILDIYRPTERYIRPVVTRGTANAVIDSVLVVQYCGRVAPTVHDTSVVATELHISPAEGTA